MPNFKGNTKIYLQPGDVNNPYGFEFTVDSAEDSGDGALPYESVISSVDVTCLNEDGDTITDIVTATQLTGNSLIVTMSYPTSSPDGKYSLKFLVNMSNPIGMIKEYSYVGIETGNIGY